MNCILAFGVRFLQQKSSLNKYSALGKVQPNLKAVDYTKEKYIHKRFRNFVCKYLMGWVGVGEEVRC